MPLNLINKNNQIKMKFVKTYEKFKLIIENEVAEPEIDEPIVKPGIPVKPTRPATPEKPELSPEHDPDYNPDEEGIERPGVDPDPMAKKKERAALDKVVKRYLNK